MSLEEKTLVILYELFENGRFIESDAPFNGMQQKYGNWSKSHGLYRSRGDAEAAKQRLIRKRTKQGYHQEKDRPDHLGKTYAGDVTLGIDTLEVDKARITDRQDGQYWYAGRKIR